MNVVFMFRKLLSGKFETFKEIQEQITYNKIHE